MEPATTPIAPCSPGSSTTLPPFSRDGFIAILNAGLPTKRVISQGLLRDEHGRVLLCELTYKQEWDLPGGVIEVGEAPALGLVRELQEELGITVEVQGLITVNWLPAWRGWDDACIFLFDLGVVDSSITEGMELQATEIKSVQWCDPETDPRQGRPRRDRAAGRRRARRPGAVPRSSEGCRIEQGPQKRKPRSRSSGAILTELSQLVNL